MISTFVKSLANTLGVEAIALKVSRWIKIWIWIGFE